MTVAGGITPSSACKNEMSGGCAAHAVLSTRPGGGLM